MEIDARGLNTCCTQSLSKTTDLRNMRLTLIEPTMKAYRGPPASNQSKENLPLRPLLLDSGTGCRLSTSLWGFDERNVTHLTADDMRDGVGGKSNPETCPCAPVRHTRASPESTIQQHMCKFLPAISQAGIATSRLKSKSRTLRHPSNCRSFLIQNNAPLARSRAQVR